MELKEAIDKYFSKQQLIDSMCKYQLYYQIGLGAVVFESIQDADEAYKKLEELNLQIDTNRVFQTIHEILFHLSREDNFEEKFDTHLKFSALVHMLDDFIEADKGLIDFKPYADLVFEKIKDERFFDESMQEQFDNDYPIVLVTWEHAISDEVARNIKDVAAEIFE